MSAVSRSGDRTGNATALRRRVTAQTAIHAFVRNVKPPRARPVKPRFVRDRFVGSPHLSPNCAHRGNGEVIYAIGRRTGRSEGVGREGRCEGPQVRVRVWGKDTHDGAAVQDRGAEVVAGASFWGGVRRSGGLAAMSIVTHVGARRQWIVLEQTWLDTFRKVVGTFFRCPGGWGYEVGCVVARSDAMDLCPFAGSTAPTPIGSAHLLEASHDFRDPVESRK